MAEWQVYVIRSSGPLFLRLPNQLCSMPPIQLYSGPSDYSARTGDDDNSAGVEIGLNMGGRALATAGGVTLSGRL
jgi:hypothetical protein